MKNPDLSLPDVLRVEGIYGKGFGIVPKYVMHDPSLSLESKAIYAYFCALAGGGEVTFPYRETILRNLGISKNTYYRHYNPLIQQGYLRTERPENRNFANIYILVSNPKKLECLPAPRGEERLRYNGLKAHGYGSIPRALMIDARLSLKAKGLYAYFCSYCGAGNCSFPQRDHILHHLSISEPTYYKALTQLKTTDYLRIIQRKNEGRFAVNDYYLNDFPGEKGESTQSPCPKNCDTEERPLPLKNKDIPPPCPKNEDTLSLPYPKKWDTKNGDTKNRDIYINNKYINNNPSIDRIGGKNLEQQARNYLRRHEPDCWESLLSEFWPGFVHRVQGKPVRRMGAYLNTSVKRFLEERAVRVPPLAIERSYDMAELERVLEQDVFL